MRIKPGPAEHLPLEEEILEGLGVSPGIAIGIVHRHEAGRPQTVEYQVAPSKIAAERARFADAVSRTQRQIARLQAKSKNLPGAVAEEMAILLDAYQQMLKGSRLVRGVETRIGERRINAEAAVEEEVAEIAASFSAMGDSYLASRIDDIKDLGQRLLRHLVHGEGEPAQPQRPQKPHVLIAEELTPAETALLDPRLVQGFAATLGGAEGHTAIMARALELPAVLGVAGLANHARSGDLVIIDGGQGRVVLRPTAETLERYRRVRAELLRHRRQLARLNKLPAVTRDGSPISLEANLELPSEVPSLLAAGAAGIGLLRTEFQFMNRAHLPGEEDQFRLLKQIVEGMGGRPVTVRTLDAGGDKLPALSGIGAGPNPALGLRAIRLGLKRPEMLETQIAAILRAAAFGPVRILLPLVTSVDEVVRVRALIERVERRLKRRRAALGETTPPLGVMIEVPGAALNADALAWHSDFLAIGTNDLTMYTLAIDRSDEQVANLYNPAHPAVLRLIQFAVAAAQRARIPVSVCGEIAGDPRFTALLLGLGIRDLSMAAANIPRVKQRIRNLDLQIATRAARMIMDQSDPARIAQLIDQLNQG